ncbi:MAG TPA: hypothetical protein VNO24_14255 [Blastocatellia bacterium]|nr:hypothetical protein [Blastocatellia bacterium]
MSTTVGRSNASDSPKPGKKIDTLAALCATAFIVILGIAAYWDRTIRVLHLFESLPYVVTAALCLRHRKFGYMLGASAGAFWLWTAGTLTTFVRNGFERVSMLLRTGHVDRPDVFIAAPAAVVTGGLVIFAVWGYSRLRNKSWSDLFLFLAAMGLVAGFFLAIFAAFAPQYLNMFKPILGN